MLKRNDDDDNDDDDDDDDDDGRCGRNIISVPLPRRNALFRACTRVYSHKGGTIYTRIPRRDQSRDRILLRRSLTRSYAGIEEAALCIHRNFGMNGEGKGTRVENIFVVRNELVIRSTCEFSVKKYFTSKQ